MCRNHSRAFRQSHLSEGPVAQWLEPAAHNGLVAGSSPAGPTNAALIQWSSGDVLYGVC